MPRISEIRVRVCACVHVSCLIEFSAASVAPHLLTAFLFQDDHISGCPRVHLCHLRDVLRPGQLCCVPDPRAGQQSKAPAVHQWSEACHLLALQFRVGYGKNPSLCCFISHQGCGLDGSAPGFSESALGSRNEWKRKGRGSCVLS